MCFISTFRTFPNYYLQFDFYSFYSYFFPFFHSLYIWEVKRKENWVSYRGWFLRYVSFVLFYYISLRHSLYYNYLMIILLSPHCPSLSLRMSADRTVPLSLRISAARYALRSPRYTVFILRLLILFNL